MRIYRFMVVNAVKAQAYQNAPLYAPPGSEAITLMGAPTPPTSNSCYANAKKGLDKNGKSKKGRVLTPEAKRWSYDCNAWAMTCLPSFAKLGVMAGANRPLRMDLVFWFDHSEIWTKDGGMKKIDPPNFCKLIVDAVAEYAGMDDTQFFMVNCQKKAYPRPGPTTPRLTDITIDYL